MSPLDPFQVSIVTQLKTSTELADFIESAGRFRIYDEVPAEPDFPYLRVGDDFTTPEYLGCSDDWEIISKIHIFSRPEPDSTYRGKREAKVIAGLVAEVLVGSQQGETPPISVDGFDVYQWSVRSIRPWEENDDHGTIHAIAELRYLLSS